VIGRAHFYFGHAEENRRVARFTIQVLAERRRQGLGRRLLEPLAAAARDADRTLLITETSLRVPGGAEFVARFGGSRGLEVTARQLAIPELDRRLSTEWRAPSSERDAEFELLVWDGPYPESELAAAAALEAVRRPWWLTRGGATFPPIMRGPAQPTRARSLTLPDFPGECVKC
jgi:hypothetical protein